MARRPGSAYRLQLRDGIGFERARRLVPYLERLGITDLYLSPPFAAREGSTHGYDVVDPTRLDPALGGRRGFGRLAAELRSRGMGLVVDVVPNHMAASPENRWWVDVLRRGPRSRFARFFDVDWDVPDAEGRIVLPILPAPVDEVLRSGGFSIGAREDRPTLRVAGSWLPLAEGSEALISERDPRWWNREREAPSRVRAYRSLLDAQAYRPVWWREGNARVNHRRFFDVWDLVALRQEDPVVFAATHALVLDLVRRGWVTGLRIDHVDGLADPAGYLGRLRRAAPSAYLVVEKILDRDERLPRDWAIDGATGYAAMNDLTDLWVDPAGWRTLGGIVDGFGGSPAASFADIRLASQRRVLGELFGAEVDSLVRRLSDLARRHGLAPGTEPLRRALVEITAALPVYRTYARGSDLPPGDRRLIAAAARQAVGRIRPEDRAALAFVRRVLLLRGTSAPTLAAYEEILRRWQLLSGPAAAKGVEDTAMYRDVRLVARNEVGGDPGVEPIEPPRFHGRVRARREGRWPLVPESTHDAKRGGDVRARLAVLSEMPEEWDRRVRAWSRRLEPARRSLRGEPVPDGHEELFLYQTLVGAWPLGDRAGFVERIEGYLVKAAREARRRTSWLDPNRDHEAGLVGFVGEALADRGFVADLEELARVVAFHGAVNSLAQTVLRSMLPGVVDVYRGAESWALDLVDPDNRRPVDLEALGRELEEIDAEAPSSEELLASWPDGRVKLWVLSRALRLRRERRELFAEGAYMGLVPEGRHRRHVVAAARRRRSAWALTVVPRLTLRLAGSLVPPLGPVWGRTSVRLPAAAPLMWRDVMTGETMEARVSGDGPVLRVAGTLRRFPVALLVPDRITHRSGDGR